MNVHKSAAISNAAMWLAVGFAVATAIYFTRRISPLWFFFLPLLGTYSSQTVTERKYKADDAETP